MPGLAAMTMAAKYFKTGRLLLLVFSGLVWTGNSLIMRPLFMMLNFAAIAVS